MNDKELFTEDFMEVTDAHVNEVSEWLNDLSITELLLLKRSYETHQKLKLAHEIDLNVH